MRIPKTTFSIVQILVSVFVIITISSCVSSQKYNALATRCGEESLTLNNKIEDLEAQLKETSSLTQRMVQENNRLKNDTTNLYSNLRLITSDYNELDKNYEKLKMQYNLNYHDAEKTLGDLKSAQEDLMAREVKLKRLQEDLNLKSKNLDELKSVLRRKDSITNSLRKAVADALMGFEGKGLTVHTKEGKVYVSLEEKLLFASGKWDVSAEGIKALKDLAKVLEKNKDISVLIEGHTDNVPLTSQNQIKDNWDLSTMRATSIVKILLANGKIDPKRLIASGRGEYLPVENNNSAINRSKNRRTEIILSPKLDELLQIIGEK